MTTTNDWKTTEILALPLPAAFSQPTVLPQMYSWQFYQHAAKRNAYDSINSKNPPQNMALTPPPPNSTDFCSTARNPHPSCSNQYSYKAVQRGEGRWSDIFLLLKRRTSNKKLDILQFRPFYIILSVLLFSNIQKKSYSKQYTFHGKYSRNTLEYRFWLNSGEPCCQ